MKHDSPLLIDWKMVPRPSALITGFLFSLLLIALCIPQLYTSNVRLKEPKEVIAQEKKIILPSGTSDVASKKANQSARNAGVRRTVTKSGHLTIANLPVGDGEPSLGVRARRHTDELMQDFKFSMNFGFHAGAKLQFASKIQGEIPKISPEEVFYEQYVIVEATIDVDGSVAAARVMSGKVPPKLEEKLIASIKGFRYAPATRDGIPIPSLMDIVIHIPS